MSLVPLGEQITNYRWMCNHNMLREQARACLNAGLDTADASMAQAS